MPPDPVQLKIRRARQTDIPQLVAMLADDALGAQREDASEPINPGYQQAFTAIDAYPNNELIVVELGQRIIGMLQLTRWAGLSPT